MNNSYSLNFVLTGVFNPSLFSSFIPSNAASNLETWPCLEVYTEPRWQRDLMTAWSSSFISGRPTSTLPLQSQPPQTVRFSSRFGDLTLPIERVQSDKPRRVLDAETETLIAYMILSLQKPPALGSIPMTAVQRLFERESKIRGEQFSRMPEEKQAEWALRKLSNMRILLGANKGRTFLGKDHRLTDEGRRYAMENLDTILAALPSLDTVECIMLFLPYPSSIDITPLAMVIEANLRSKGKLDLGGYPKNEIDVKMARTAGMFMQHLRNRVRRLSTMYRDGSFTAAASEVIEEIAHRKQRIRYIKTASADPPAPKSKTASWHQFNFVGRSSPRPKGH